jgi:hypothetical protein
MPGGVVVGMFDVGLCEVPGSIPAGGVYFSTPIWHHFPMPESTVSFWLICLISLSILHKFKKMIKITLRSKKIKKDPCKVSDGYGMFTGRPTHNPHPNPPHP